MSVYDNDPDLGWCERCGPEGCVCDERGELEDGKVMPVCNDYNLSSPDANELIGAVLLPFDIRRRLLGKYAAERGRDALVDLFANFIGLSNSVVGNAREWLEAQAIVHANLHPYEAEKINCPTLFGALQGVELANRVDQKKTCVGCAFRLGSQANQSPSTTTDAMLCADRAYDEQFMCHERLDEVGETTVPCGGYSQLARR